MTDKRQHPDRRGWRRRRGERHEDLFNRAALVVLVLLYLGGFAMVRNQANQIKHTARDAAHNAAQVKRLAQRNEDALRRIEVARMQGRLLLCASQNDQNRILRGLIIGGTVSSKPFERQLRALGFPPYKQRIAQARAEAAQLARLNCVTLKAIR